jgi:hypothetical protein
LRVKRHFGRALCTFHLVMECERLWKGCGGVALSSKALQM